MTSEELGIIAATAKKVNKNKYHLLNGKHFLT